MGAEVQSKMYLPGYYSMRDLNDNINNGSWSLCHENRMFGHYHDIFTSRPAIDGYAGYDREQLRQTILKHESIFRHQLHELHRLYKIQSDMMNEVRRKVPYRPVRPDGTSQSSFNSSHFLYEDGKKRHSISNMPSVAFSCDQPFMSGADSTHSQFSSMRGKIMQPGHESTQNGLISKDCESLESKGKKCQGKLLDLELPADAYINNGELGQGVSGGSGVESCPLKQNQELPYDRDGNMSIHRGTISSHDSDTFGSNLHQRGGHVLTDLNEPISGEEASTSASVDILGNTTCSKDEKHRWDLSATSNSSFHLSKEISQDVCRGRNAGVSNLSLVNERMEKGWLSCNFESGQNDITRCSFYGSFRSEGLPAAFALPQVEPSKAQKPAIFPSSDQSKTEPWIKRTIFGVEISERSHNASVVSSHAPSVHALVSQSEMANSKSSSIIPSQKLPTNLSQNPMLVCKSPCFSTFAHSSNGSVALVHKPVVMGEKFLVGSNSRSSATLRNELSYQGDLCLGSQLESKESWVCSSSNGSGCLNGISDSNSFSEKGALYGQKRLVCQMDAKSAETVNVNAISPNSCWNSGIFQSNLSSVDGPRKQENPQGLMPWFQGMSLSNDQSSKGCEESYKMNLDFLQNNSLKFANTTEIRKGPSQNLVHDSSSVTCVHDTELRRNEAREDLGTKKILGCPIFGKHISKDLCCPGSSLRPNHLPSPTDGANSNKVRLLNIDVNDDPMIESGKQSKVDNLVMEKGLDNSSTDLRGHIDLNLCVIEEEAQATPSPRTNAKIAVEIDLEAPVVVENETEITSGGEFLDSKLNKLLNSFQDESRDPYEGLIRVAAEALVAISCSCLHNLQGDAACQHLEAAQNHSLCWFAEVISSYMGETENQIESISVCTNDDCPIEPLHNGIDYFEFMTLNMKEAEVENCHYEPHVLEKPKDETTLPRRPRRGQARKGRQRKDFQRDILPGLTSLSRNEVTEDLQTFEGLIKATGGTWQSVLSQRNTGKSGCGRGRRRSVGSSPSSTVTRASSPPTHQPKCGELGLEEVNLTGWGKKTRRPPRQRCLLNNPCPLK